MSAKMAGIASACFAVMTLPLSISAAEYCFPHLPGANWEKPYSLQSWDWVRRFDGER